MAGIFFHIAASDTGYSGPPINFLLQTKRKHLDADSQGNIIGITGQVEMTEAKTYKSDVLSDGRIVVGWADPISVTCYEVGSITTESWSTGFVGTQHGYYYMCMKVLTNDNIAVSWTDTDEDGKYGILDSDGNILSGPLSYDSGNGSYQGYDSMVALLDGGFAIKFNIFKEVLDADALTIRNADGTERVAAFYPSYEDYGGGENRINVFPDGNIVIFFGNDIYTYNPTTGAVIIDGTSAYSTLGTGYIIVSAALSIWTDKLAVFTLGSGGNTILGTIIHSNGTHPDVYDKEVFSGTTVNPVDVIATQDNQFILQTQDTATGSFGEHYTVLDASLDYVSGPTEVFTGRTDDSEVTPGWLEGCAI